MVRHDLEVSQYRWQYDTFVFNTHSYQLNFLLINVGSPHFQKDLDKT